jgi:hypothetical protein
MKVLIWVGAPVDGRGREDWRDMARVWVDDQHKVHVEAMASEFEEFACIAQEEIDRRLADPRERIYHRTGSSWAKEKGDKVIAHGSVTKHVASVPGKSNFLEVLRSDVKLTGGGLGRDIAGYRIYDGASRIVEE